MKKVSRLIRPTSSSATSNTSSTPPIKQDPYQSTLLKFGISLDLNSKKQNIDFPTRIEISPRIHTPIQLDTKIINVTPLKHTSRFTSIRGEKYNANWWFNDLDQQVDDLFMEDAKKISYQNLHKRTISHEKIPIKLYLDCIRDTPNGLLYLTQNQQWDIYKAIQNAPELTKTDIDRFLSAMTSTFKFSQKIPKVIESRSLEIFTDLKHLGFVPDSKTWSLMFRAFKGNLNFLTNIRNHVIKERSIQEKQSKKFTDLISEESVRTLLAAINTHKSPSIENLLHMIWLDIKSVKLELSLRLGVGFILLFRNTGGPDALNNVMNVHKILKQRVIKQPWNRHVYDALIDAYSELGSYKAVISLYEELQSKFILSMFYLFNIGRIIRH